MRPNVPAMIGFAVDANHRRLGSRRVLFLDLADVALLPLRASASSDTGLVEIICPLAYRLLVQFWVIHGGSVGQLVVCFEDTFRGDPKRTTGKEDAFRLDGRN